MGRIKDGEKQFLQQWRNESQENNALFLKLTSSKFIDKLPHKKEELERDMASEWIRLKNRMSRKQKIHKLSYWISSSAAALLLLLAVGILFDLNELYDKKLFAKNEPLVLAGSSKAILQLADGKEILLRSDSVLYMLKNRQVNCQ